MCHSSQQTEGSNLWFLLIRYVVLCLSELILWYLFRSGDHLFFYSGRDNKLVEVNRKLISSQCKVARLRSRLLRCIIQVKNLLSLILRFRLSLTDQVALTTVKIIKVENLKLYAE